MGEFDPNELLSRVEQALNCAATIYATFDSGRIAELKKTGGDPVTEADLELDKVLRAELLRSGEGWLSEETADDLDRLTKDLVWIVDPLDGTREFIDGLPEFCTSVAAVVGGHPVVGGILNPAARLRIVGALGEGVLCNGRRVDLASSITALHETKVLASRSEVKRGEWVVVQSAGITVEPMGSVAYKMARVAAGLDGATWTPVPKHEWDVAGGAALLSAGGGSAVDVVGKPLVFNQTSPWVSGVIAVPPGFESHITQVSDLIRRQTDSK